MTDVHPDMTIEGWMYLYYVAFTLEKLGILTESDGIVKILIVPLDLMNHHGVTS